MPATTLDFMRFDVELADCFVAAAAAGLGTVIGYAINKLFEEKEKKDSAPIDTVANVAFCLSSIFATTTGVALAHSCRTSTFWYPGSILLSDNMRGSPVPAVAACCLAAFALNTVGALPCSFIAPLASFTACAASFMQKQMRWPAVHDNPRHSGLFIAISMGTVCAPNYVRLMMKLFEIDYGKYFSLSLSTISAMTAAAAITRICGAPASVVFAATFSPLFAFPLAFVGKPRMYG
jgi:hypothetical protein